MYIIELSGPFSVLNAVFLMAIFKIQYINDFCCLYDVLMGSFPKI